MCISNNCANNVDGELGIEFTLCAFKMCIQAACEKLRKNPAKGSDSIEVDRKIDSMCNDDSLISEPPHAI